MKDQVFTLIVKGAATRRAAETAVLTAFAGRAPDFCRFHLLPDNDFKRALEQARKEGEQTGRAAAMRDGITALEKLKREQS